MNTIDSLNHSLFFTASAQASNEANKKLKQEKTQKKTSATFSSSLKKHSDESKLISEGLPPQLAGLSMEDSLVFLKDAVDSAADKLNEDMNPENFSEFRKSVSQFLKYISKNNYEVIHKKRFGETVSRGSFGPYLMEKRKKDPYVLVQIIDTKLENLASEIINTHSDKLKLLAQVDEIKGLVVDFFAS